MSFKPIASICLLGTLGALLYWCLLTPSSEDSPSSSFVIKPIEVAEEVGLEPFRKLEIGGAPVAQVKSFTVEHPFNFSDLNGDMLPDLVVGNQSEKNWGAGLAIHLRNDATADVDSNYEFEASFNLNDKIESGWIPPG